jgi:hypothetical protein
MFTLEIKGKAIVVTNATQDEAAGLFESEEFKEDLKTLTSEGQPLWDGSAPLTVRPASEDEVDSFDEAMNDEGIRGRGRRGRRRRADRRGVPGRDRRHGR